MQKVPEIDSFSSADISDTEISYYQAINKQILDTIISTYDDSSPEVQENQDIQNLKIPKARHKVWDFIRTKIFHQNPKKWQSWESVATNHKYQLENGILNILVKQNVNKDTYILYHTTANQILKLQNLGLTKSEALTSQVIETVGRYALVVENRRIKSGITTHKTQLKSYLVSDLQEHIRLLQPIERLICKHGEDEKTYKDEVIEAFQAYLDSLNYERAMLEVLIRTKQHRALGQKDKKIIDTSMQTTPDLLNKLLAHDHHYLETRLKNLNLTVKSTHNFCIDYADNPTVTSKELSDQLQSFLRSQINHLVHCGQALNDQLTHNAKDVIFRGKLRDYLVDADKVICNYVFDQLNPITRAHQSDYRTSLSGDAEDMDAAQYGENNVVYHSHVHAGHHKSDLENVLIGITSIDHRNNQLDDDKKVKTVKSAAWTNFSTQSKKQKGRRFLAWSLTTLLHIPLSALNVVITAVTGSAPIANFMLKSENAIRERFGVKEEYSHDFFEFKEKLGVNNVYTSTAVGRMVNRVVREIGAVLIQSPKYIGKKIFAQLKLFKKDFETGLWGYLYRKIHKPHPQQSQASEEKNAESALLDEAAKVRVCKLYVSGKELNHIGSVPDQQVTYAMPKEHLTPFQPHDLLSSLMSGLEGSINIFKDGIFEKHPMTAFIATLAYAFGGSAVLTPVMLQAILVKAGLSAVQASAVIEACSQIGKATATGTVNEAMAAGFALAKLTGVTLNTMSQGFDSALADIINEIRKNPILYGAGLGLAYGFGNVLTDAINIPGFTDRLNEELGSVRPLAQTMIGGKVFLIALESALPDEKEHKSALAHFLGDIAKLLLITLRVCASIITLSPRPWIDLGTQFFRGAVIVGHAVNRLAVLTGQILAQVPKTLMEVASTFLVNTLKLVNLCTLPFRKKEDQSVIGVSPLLKAKSEALSVGYSVGFFFREKISRGAERKYGKAMQSLDRHKHQHVKDEASSQAKIMSNLQMLQNNSDDEGDSVLIAAAPESKTSANDARKSLDSSSTDAEEQRQDELTVTSLRQSIG